MSNTNSSANNQAEVAVNAHAVKRSLPQIDSPFCGDGDSLLLIAEQLRQRARELSIELGLSSPQLMSPTDGATRFEEIFVDDPDQT